MLRAAYVEPRWARRGLTALLVRISETAARIAGYHRFEALCTPPSEALPYTLGYQLVDREAPLVDGITMSGAHMRKVAVLTSPS